MTKETNVNFQIKGVELLNFEYSPPSANLPKESNFNFDVSIEHKVNQKDKHIFVLVGIGISLVENSTLLGKILVSCVFKVQNYDEVVKENNTNEFSLDDNIIDLFNSISISTTRGVMASKFRGTVLHNTILPVIHPQDLKMQQAKNYSQ